MFHANFALALVFQFLKVRGLYGGGANGRERRTNCPSCGARVPAEADACDYCGDPIDR